MVSKFLLLVAIVLVFMLPACSTIETLYDTDVNKSITSTDDVEVIDLDAESADIADFNIIPMDAYSSLSSPDSSEIYQASDDEQNEQTSVCPVCLNEICTSFYGIRQKFDFHIHPAPFYIEYYPWIGYWIGVAIINWGSGNYNTAPFTLCVGGTSDQGAGYLKIQDGRIVIDNFSDQPNRIRELTTTQWDDWGIQIFTYGGDVLLIGERSAFLQMPGLEEDGFRPDLWIYNLHDMRPMTLYFFYHELPGSRLWRLLMGYK